jgi:hypothetical protein
MQRPERRNMIPATTETRMRAHPVAGRAGAPGGQVPRAFPHQVRARGLAQPKSRGCSWPANRRSGRIAGPAKQSGSAARACRQPPLRWPSARPMPAAAGTGRPARPPRATTTPRTSQLACACSRWTTMPPASWWSLKCSSSAITRVSRGPGRLRPGGLAPTRAGRSRRGAHGRASAAGVLPLPGPPVPGPARPCHGGGAGIQCGAHARTRTPRTHLAPTRPAVTTCSSGQQALKLLREKESEFDLVLSDVYMPGVGRAAAREGGAGRGPHHWPRQQGNCLDRQTPPTPHPHRPLPAALGKHSPPPPAHG